MLKLILLFQVNYFNQYNLKNFLYREKYLSKKEDKGKKPSFRKAKIEDFNGVKIAYERKELEQFVPHLVTEISENKKKVKIDSIYYKIERNSKKEQQTYSNQYPEELYDPKAIDFIRRCCNKEEAIEILDYLLKRGEIPQEEYDFMKNKVSQERGLKELIEEHGGFKEPGYYEKKFRKLEDIKKSKKKINNNIK